MTGHYDGTGGYSSRHSVWSCCVTRKCFVARCRGCACGVGRSIRPISRTGFQIVAPKSKHKQSSPITTVFQGQAPNFQVVLCDICTDADDGADRTLAKGVEISSVPINGS